MSAESLIGHRTSRRAFLGGAAATALVVTTGGAAAAIERAAAPRAGQVGVDLATGWVRVLYDVVMAEGLTPPAAARYYHYTSLTMYETALAEMPNHRSLGVQLHDLARSPRPNKPIDLSVAVSEALALVAPALLPAPTEKSRAMIAAHRQAVVDGRTGRTRDGVDRFSRLHGQRVAEHLLAWIAEDGYAEAVTMAFTPPVGPGLWRPTPPNFGTAIEPHWGQIRPAMLKTADEVAPEPPVPFSIDAGSAFHEQALATYNQSKANTEEQIAIARFWTDNPRLSGLPSGHWFLLLADLADNVLNLSFEDAVDGFVRLGVALHDAFLNCWTWKYRYNLIRPVSYIQDYVDPGWQTLVNSPQFPEYSSGHSVASGAAEVVLTSLYGEFSFTDRTGEPRELAARDFTSFNHAAEEAGISRLYGGIHYPMAIDLGLAQGREIGRLVDRRLKTRRLPRR